MLDRAKVALNLHISSYLCEESLNEKFRPLVPLLHVNFFVMGGGLVGVKGGFYCSALNPSLKNLL